MSAVEMKDSGVEWLGEIPAHWQSMSLSDVADVLAGQSPASSSYNDEGLGLPFFQGKAEFGSRFPTVANWCTEPEQISESGDILISVRAPVGDVNVAPYECCIGRGLAAIRANGRSHNIFLYYLLIHTKSPLESEGTGSTFKSIDKTILRRVAVPLPPLHEQRAIASYLDRETAKIDRLISKTDALNALLSEKRIALISQAVTKGLDAGAEMRDSGVEWLGEIPRGWEVWKLSHAYKQISSGTTPNTNELSYFDGTVNWVTTSELRENTITSTKASVTALAMRDYPTLKVYPPGTLLIAMYGATIGRMGVLGIPACTNQACCALTGSDVLDTSYAFYCLYVSREHIIQQSFGGGQPNINQEIIRRLRMPVPPLHEQRAIAAYLDRETTKIDDLINKNDELIALLREKRSALISAAVTGKISVPSVSSVVK